MIKGSVGVAGVNQPADVKEVQHLLNGFAARLQISPLAEDGDCGPATRAAIKAFQQDVVGMDIPDGRIDVNGATWKSLTAAPPAGSGDAPLAPGEALTALLVSGPRTALKPADFTAAATSLGCDVPAIQAVAKVESSRAAFDQLGRPTILYERHLFRRFTKNKFDSQPDLSNPESGGYGKFSEQYPKLARAYRLDAEAALKACSWGMFQILGSNHVAAGFAGVVPYVKAMCQAELDHLNAFVSFIKASGGMHAALRQHDWETFARLYNGPAFHKNHYDERLADAHRQLSGGN